MGLVIMIDVLMIDWSELFISHMLNTGQTLFQEPMGSDWN